MLFILKNKTKYYLNNNNHDILNQPIVIKQFYKMGHFL